MTEEEKNRIDNEIDKYHSEYKSAKELAEYWDEISRYLTDLLDAVKEICAEININPDILEDQAACEKHYFERFESKCYDALETLEKRIDVLKDAASDAKCNIEFRVENGNILTIDGEEFTGCRGEYYDG